MVNGVTTTSTISATSNQMLSTSGGASAQYGYDPQGNLTTLASTPTYHYDAFNRMDQAGGTRYYVNPEGQRLRKQAGGTMTYFAPDQGGALLAENQGGAWTDYIWLNGRLIGRLSNGQLLAIHDDQLGRPEAITDASGAVVWRAQNLPFTRNVLTSSVPALNLGFPGQYYDSETGYWNNGARDYDPKSGRYIESDPIGQEGGTDTYIYADGNPIQNTDPSGLLCFDFSKFADEIEENRADLGKTAAALGGALGVGTMPKTAAELRGLGVPVSQLNPYTSQLSRWAGRFGARALRTFGRTTAGVALSTAATASLIAEGAWDATVEVKAAIHATSTDDSCECKG